MKNNILISRRQFLLILLSVPLLSFAKTSQPPAADIDYYTCTMHPQIHSPVPGNCPICGMTLVPVLKKTTLEKSSEPAAPTIFTIPVQRLQQIGVTFAIVERRPLQRTIRAVGIVAPDKNTDWKFTARASGYVTKLFVSAPGEPVKKNQPLMAIYSPELYAAEEEFTTLLAARDAARTPQNRADAEQLVDAARSRFAQWNIAASEISALEKSRHAPESLTLRSPFAGIVQRVPFNPGGAFQTGDALVEVADLSKVWVWAEFYQNEIAWLKIGSNVAISGFGSGKKLQGAISVISPFLDATQRTAKARIDVANRDLALQPGMYVNVEMAVSEGSQLAVPVSAVLPTGERNLVFVDHGEGRLEPRFIKLGEQFGDFYAVKSGLKNGERVVTSANFLIDAESKIQGALKAW